MYALPHRRCRTLISLLLILLAAPLPATPLGPLPFGVELGASRKATKAAFTPQGEGLDTARWLSAREGKRVRHLAWRCEAQNRCFATPAAADFWFVDGKLAASTLVVDPDRTAPGKPAVAILLEQEGRARLGRPDAVVNAAGRRVRYYVRDGQTVAWAQDGRDTQIKLYLDRLHPVGRAESVAAGARPQGLEKLRAGKAWAAGQLALDKQRWQSAVARFDEVYTDRKASPLARSEARVVLAMALAARAKARVEHDAAGAQADLKRARKLAPEMKADLDAFAQSLGLK